MPLYEVLHTCPLTETQKDELAEAITAIHSEKFTTPRMFVQVRFFPTPPAAPDRPITHTYIGGRPKVNGNYIRAHIRTGASRTHADYVSLCTAVTDAWARIAPMPRAKGAAPVDYSLWSCHVVGGLVAGWEGGFVMPTAGQDVAWLREHWEEFEMKAQGGDEQFRDLVEDVKTRELLEGKTAKRRLEDMLGWGDAA